MAADRIGADGKAATTVVSRMQKENVKRRRRPREKIAKAPGRNERKEKNLEGEEADRRDQNAAAPPTEGVIPAGDGRQG